MAENRSAARRRFLELLEAHRRPSRRSYGNQYAWAERHGYVADDPPALTSAGEAELAAYRAGRQPPDDPE